MADKQYFCDELNNVISCFHDRIMSCCTGQDGPIYIPSYTGQKIDWEAFRKIKTDAFALLNEMDIDKSPCKGCFFLREKREDDKISEQFNILNISHWTQCNCGCIYCARMYSSLGKITTESKNSDYYDIVPLLKELYANELIDRKNAQATIQGGDISVLKEFEPMIKTFLDEGIGYFVILTNNLVYQPIIEDLLKLNKITLSTSLDCGNADVYKKLKRVDGFDTTIANLKRYIQCTENAAVVVKYILVEHFNDNYNEIKAFINLMSDIGVREVEFTIDNKWSLFTDLDKNPFPPHFGNLYLYFKKLCLENGIKMNIWGRTQAVIDKYAFINI